MAVERRRGLNVKNDLQSGKNTFTRISLHLELASMFLEVVCCDLVNVLRSRLTLWRFRPHLYKNCCLFYSDVTRFFFAIPPNFYSVFEISYNTD